MGKLWRLVDYGGIKRSPRQRNGEVGIGGNMDMSGGLSCRKMQIGGGLRPVWRMKYIWRLEFPSVIFLMERKRELKILNKVEVEMNDKHCVRPCTTMMKCSCDQNTWHGTYIIWPNVHIYTELFCYYSIYNPKDLALHNLLSVDHALIHLIQSFTKYRNSKQIGKG